jgi:hypothetical protein
MDNEVDNDDRGADRPKGAWAISMVFAAAVFGGLVGCNEMLADAYPHAWGATKISPVNGATTERMNTQAESAPRVLYLSALTLRPPQSPDAGVPAARIQQSGEVNPRAEAKRPIIDPRNVIAAYRRQRAMSVEPNERVDASPMQRQPRI